MEATRFGACTLKKDAVQLLRRYFAGGKSVAAALWTVWERDLQRAVLRIERSGSIVYSGKGKEVRVYGQLKHNAKKAGSLDIDKFTGSLSRLPANQRLGLFISTQGYSDDAIGAVQQSPWRIITAD